MESRWSSNAIMGLSDSVIRHKRSVMKFMACCLASVLVCIILLEYSGLPRHQSFMGGIFCLAALLWITEALPLFATSLIVVGLQIVLLANPGDWPHIGFDSLQSPSYRKVISDAADPGLMLFFGGFLLAHASQKEKVDSRMASFILRLFGYRPKNILFGLMTITAFFSMWMSNTATTAMMITLVVPMVVKLSKEDAFRKALVLCIPFAANIGGMGTPIGSPPNAVAVSLLSGAGYDVGFLEWIVVALPFMLVFLAFAWLLLIYMFPPKRQTLDLGIDSAPMCLRGWFVMAVFALTILLWLTGNYHGLPSAVVALVPAVAFTATGLLSRNDVNNMEWDILLLIAGGISLGAGMTMTGLDKSIIALMPQTGAQVVGAFILATLVLSTFMSNTAAANLILPLGISFAQVAAASASPTALAMSIALSASAAMALPISTPPNAIAYSQGEIVTKDMFIVGGIIGAFSTLSLILFSQKVIEAVGIS